MSSNNFPREDAAVNQLYATIKEQLEKDGVLRDLRCLLQSKMIAMMKDKKEPNSLLQRPHTSSLIGDPRMKLLHQLIMEYLHWHGLHYTAEMFSMESCCENVSPMRQRVEGMLGSFDHDDLPILLQLICSNYMAK